MAARLWQDRPAEPADRTLDGFALLGAVADAAPPHVAGDRLAGVGLVRPDVASLIPAPDMSLAGDRELTHGRDESEGATAPPATLYRARNAAEDTPSAGERLSVPPHRRLGADQLFSTLPRRMSAPNWLF